MGDIKIRNSKFEIKNSKLKRMDDILVVGLTGGPASGKTTVARIFKSLGAIIIDADKIAKQIVKPKSLIWQKIVDCFGTKILNEDSTINRGLLGELIFDNEVYRKKLNEIMHPEIIHKIEQRVNTLRSLASAGCSIIIIDAPLLIEANMVSMVDKLIVVTASLVTQIKRMMERDNLSEDMAKKRIYAQMPLEEKVKLADIVIDTDCPKKEISEKVTKVWNEW
ncbi:MAG: dephospho-CoA kinase [Nitrospirota bacterium]